MKKKEEVHEALLKLRKKYGENVLTLANDGYPPVEAIPTGCFAIDRVIGVGGLPRGRILELYGEPSSGKTATCLFLISEVQKQGGTCAFLDAEYSFNGDFASAIGVNTKKLFVAQPATLEEAADTIRALVSTNQIDLIVVDSVAALVPKREVEGEELLANSMAVQAQLMSKMLRVLTGEVARSKTVLIFVNHLKEKMGVFWGDKTTTPGGKSLKFFASVRLAVSKGETIKGKNDEQIGSTVKIVAQKNKVAPPWRKGAFELLYASGVNQEADTLDTAEELKVVIKEGNTYLFGSEKLGVGREKTIEALKNNKELYEKIHKETKEAIKNEK
jgi:recombination protein RecA